RSSPSSCWPNRSSWSRWTARAPPGAKGENDNDSGRATGGIRFALTTPGRLCYNRVRNVEAEGCPLGPCPPMRSVQDETAVFQEEAQRGRLPGEGRAADAQDLRADGAWAAGIGVAPAGALGATDPDGHP